MSLNSLVWGQTWFFKIFPIGLIGGYLLFFRAIVKVFFPVFKGWQVVQFAIVLSSAYAIGLPGYYEGFFWSSALAGYQLSWLCMCTGFLLCYRYRYIKVSPVQVVLWLVAGVITGGFHELIGFFTIGIAICIALWVQGGPKKYNLAWLWLATGAFVSFVFQALSRGNYQKAHIIAGKEATRDLWVFIQPIFQFGYHMVRGFLLNPLWWAVLFTLVLVSRQYAGQIPCFSLRHRRVLLMALFTIAMAVFPAFFVGVIEGAKSPLRVIHLGYGLLYLVGIAVMLLVLPISGGFLSAISEVVKYRKTVVAILVIGLFFKTSALLMPLFTGKAIQYNTEVESRFAKIKAMKGNPVVAVSCLKAQPLVLCPVDICNDPTLLGYLERVFQQRIVIADSLVLVKPPL